MQGKRKAFSLKSHRSEGMCLNAMETHTSPLLDWSDMWATDAASRPSRLASEALRKRRRRRKRADTPLG